MKILIIPDLHGKDIWKKLVSDEYDKIIFLGDYVDSFDHTDSQIINNFKEIIEYKKTHMDLVELLLGNHCVMYYLLDEIDKLDFTPMCSGYRGLIGRTLNKMYKENADLFKCVWEHGNYLLSHAGFSDAYVRRVLKNDMDIEKLFKERDKRLFQVSRIRGGTDKQGGIFWASFPEDVTKPYKGKHQIVGHTKKKEPKIITHDGGTIECVDVLDYITDIDELKKILVREI